MDMCFNNVGLFPVDVPSLDELKVRTLQVTVWSYDKLKENEFLGAAHIPLADLNLNQETIAWFPLHRMSLNSPPVGPV
jgi:phosphatidylinositol-4-phosphate 3-kinase